MFIEYFGPREKYRDGIYGTGDWVKGQRKEVPNEVGIKMVLHTGVYAEAETPEGDTPSGKIPAEKVEKKTELARDEFSEADAVRAAIPVMDANQVRAFIMSNFNQKVGKNVPLDECRRKASVLLDQYGLL